MTRLQETQWFSEVVAKDVSSCPRDWMGFLNTASRLYRYPFPDVLLIHGQRPDATACIPLETWNQKMNRWVKRGAKGIALIDDTGPKRRLRYVFDISDTRLVEGGRTPVLWKLEGWQEGMLLSALTDAYGLKGEDAADLNLALMEIASRTAEDNLQDAMHGLWYEVEGTYLEGLEEETIRRDFRELLKNSIFYALSSRCGQNPMEYLEEGDFSSITDFNTIGVLTFLGNAVSSSVAPILMEIGQRVREMCLEESQKIVAKQPAIGYNEFNTLKREREGVEGGKEYGADIPQGGGLYDPRFDHRGDAGNNREIWDAPEVIPEGEPDRLVPEHDADREIGQTSGGDRESSVGEDGNIAGGASGEISGAGQKGRPDGLDSSYEQPDGYGGREHPAGISLQLSGEGTEQGTDGNKAGEDAPAFVLPALPTVGQQIWGIERHMQELCVWENTIPADVVDDALRAGGNQIGSKLRIISNFMFPQPEEKYIEFIRQEYGTGGRGLVAGGTKYSAWHDELGLQVAVGDTVVGQVPDKVFLTWEEVSRRIHQLLIQGKYAPQEVLDAAYSNAIEKDAKEVISYQAKDGFAWEENGAFITKDEIDDFLTKGIDSYNWRLAVYSYFMQDKTNKERAGFIKRKYGIGGRSHALSGSKGSHAVYDGKGLRLSKSLDGGITAEIFLGWPAVAKRIAHLIKNDRYLKAEDFPYMPEYEKGQMAGRVLGFFHNIPDDIPRPWTGAPYPYEHRADVTSLLSSGEGQETLLKHMEQALEALPEDFKGYVQKARILEELQGYIEGTYTIFPARENEAGMQGNEGIQMSLSDFVDMGIASKQEEKNREPDIGRTGNIREDIPTPMNFRIIDDDLGVGGPKQKFRANMEAIILLKKLENEKRMATPAEQEILSRYVGWGSIPAAFEEGNDSWASEYMQLKQTLTDKEYRHARVSTLNAFYTPPVVIHAIYEALGNMGLAKGNVLEPACGTGNFMGLVPEEMDGLRMYGIEVDSISGRIAGQLYQKNSISIQSFETAQYPDSFFDCVVGNVPFGSYQVADRRYDRFRFLIHDYFIAKSLDLVRPGGVVAVITSSGTMDKQNPSVRQYIAERADLLGAIRLPENTFLKNAGTEVVADILFFQKRDYAVLEQPEWVKLGTTPEGHSINSYFANHPEMVLGNLVMESALFGKQLTVKPISGALLADQLKEAVRHIKGDITDREPEEILLGGTDASIPADPSVKNFSFADINGKVYYRENSKMNLMELPAKTTERILGMVKIRDITQELIRCQMEDGSDAEVEALQKKLGRQYDSFTKKYGLISSNANRRAFIQDSSYCLLAALELVDEDGNLERKADIFTKRTIRKAEPVTSVDTASEALAVSIGEKAGVDITFMAMLSGKTKEEVTGELTGVIFKNPVTDKWETADEYLSGNVREKLRVAKQFAENHLEYAPNVTYLEKVQPKDLDASEIEVRLGATWVEDTYVTQFMGELLQTPANYLGSKIEARYAKETGRWHISGKNLDSLGNSLVTSTYGTDRANAYRLLEDALNLRDTKIYDKVTTEDGKEKRVLNKAETMVAQQKQEMIKEAFKEWIFKDIDRREEVCRIYNELFNSICPREYDGSHIRFVGMNPEITLMQHQKNAVAHILYGGNTLLAHSVGAGKTFEMVAAGMESKRLGLSHKNLYVVPNHLTEQWGSDFLRLYPGANILVATKKDFEPANRKKFCARIATGDYDGIIIGHSQFERIPLSIKRQAEAIEQQIDDIILAILNAKTAEGEHYTIKEMEKTKKLLEARLEKLNNQERKDNVVTFEELGVDRLFVDESHFYKNLFLYTKMRNVAGIAQTDAQKSSDMFMKCQYMDEITGGRGITFATGTPISNSMVELYTIMRYLQHDLLRELGLRHFDAWAAAFGETVTSIELSPEGTGYRAKTRFARFYNLPELMSIFKECADIQTADILDIPVPEAEYINEALKPSQEQQEMVKAFAERAEAVRGGGVDPAKDNMLRITNDGRKCALDQRLLNDMLPDVERSKINCCVENTFNIWEKTINEKSTQIIFCDLSTPKSGAFNVYDDVREKLVAMGVPREQVAFIHEAGTEAKKVELFAKVRSGQVRILLGSTPKLGAGTNVQDRLIALHHLDCPWKPSELEQQEGRILRQGNRNRKVQIYRYVTESTFDAYMWQLLENKQKFISQVMTSKSPVRSCEDVDDAALSYAEIKALATGNVYIKEKMELDIQVSKLKLLKSDYISQKYRLEADITRNYPAEIAVLKERIVDLTADKALTAPVFQKVEGEDSFAIEIGGRAYTDRKEAGEALIDICKSIKKMDMENQVGSFHGFNLAVSFDSFFVKYILNIRGKCSHKIDVGKDALGNMQRISNVLAKIPEDLEKVQQKLENVERNLAIAKEEVTKPFAKEVELSEKLERLAELNVLLNMDEKRPSEAVMLDEGQEPEAEEYVTDLEMALNEDIKEIACDIGEKYFMIQVTEGGFDYTFYDKDFQSLDGGIYENPDISMRQAMADILSVEGVALKDIRWVDYDEFMEKAERAGMERAARERESVLAALKERQSRLAGQEKKPGRLSKYGREQGL